MMDICHYEVMTNIIDTDTMISYILMNVDTIVNIIVNIIVIIGGILGFSYIKNLREKQIDSTFSYLTKLNIRLNYFHELLIVYKDEIMDYFIPEDYRREISADRISLITEMIRCFSENAKETLKFLMYEDNQLPAQKGWINCFNNFIVFLIDCEQLNQNTYFKWTARDDLEEQKEKYYNNNLKNIEHLLEMVHVRQSELEDNIFENR